MAVTYHPDPLFFRSNPSFPGGNAMMDYLDYYQFEADVAKKIKGLKRDEHEIVVLMADDDEENFLQVKTAFDESAVGTDLRWVEDGEEAMYYLSHAGMHPGVMTCPRPHLILLDIVMPRKDGLETLKEIKAHPRLKKIPVALLTSSHKEEYLYSGLRLGADSFMLKPLDLYDMTRMAGSLPDYYFAIVRLPEKVQSAAPIIGRGGIFQSMPSVVFRSLH
jgi:CheY-like chemotaxis protein